jgi:hypothetical protein
MTASKCSLRAWPCSLRLSVITKIGVLEQPENPRLVNERGGFERPARESPPGDSSPRQLPARHGGLAPLPSGATLSLCSGLGESPPTGARCCRRGEIISRGHNGRSGWFWRFQLPTPSHAPSQVITAGDWGMWGGRRAHQNKLANHPTCAVHSQSTEHRAQSTDRAQSTEHRAQRQRDIGKCRSQSQVTGCFSRLSLLTSHISQLFFRWGTLRAPLFGEIGPAATAHLWLDEGGGGRWERGGRGERGGEGACAVAGVGSMYRRATLLLAACSWVACRCAATRMPVTSTATQLSAVAVVIPHVEMNMACSIGALGLWGSWRGGGGGAGARVA